MNLVSDKSKAIAEKFFPNESASVIAQLQEYCEYLSEFFSEEKQPETYERFCLAILKIAKTSNEKFSKAIELGKIDYRDLLVSAGFGNSITIHNDWASKILNEKT
ncbi:MAG: hypothetical protein OQK70_09130 [Gammaproteobacteria bacterium]|nr:hypothetical protein [Gammaproteobacteria bacterium]